MSDVMIYLTFLVTYLVIGFLIGTIYIINYPAANDRDNKRNFQLGMFLWIVFAVLIPFGWFVAVVDKIVSYTDNWVEWITGDAK